MTHAELVQRAVKWLKNQNCGIVLHDGMRAHTANGEEPDAIGWRGGSLSILIECKASRSDFLSDRKKKFRRYPSMGMGNWRFYMCPPGVIHTEELPDRWGLLYVREKKVQRVHGVPSNTGWYTRAPFHEAYKQCELEMMYSALRRLEIRGCFDKVYEKIPR